MSRNQAYRLAGEIELQALQKRIGYRGSEIVNETPVLLKEPKRSFTLDLAWPPTLNHSNADGFRGGRKTLEYKDFFEHTAMLVLSKRIKPLVGSLSVVIVAYPPDNRTRDLDNLIKPILDAMQAAGCYANDKAFDHIEITRATESIGGMVLVTVREI